ncbi:DUF389 domain-containing protein [Hymenobacter saemangeumensis]|uniref:DUF389 domain-containing protein n=1 Tax=Hymenobacter saemangeumensis TaxID=1084522 RepID=A0ABP8IMC7_9BACT
MPRTVELTLPAAYTATVLEEIQRISGIISLRLQRGASLKPVGDVVSLEITDLALPTLMRLIARQQQLHPEVSLSTSQPLSVISSSHSQEISTDVREATWEEMESMISRDSNMNTNGLLTMVLAGIIAAVGISTNAVHLVVGAMVIAPGFEPIVRVPLGIIGKHATWKRGVIDTGKGYAAMLVAAALAALVLRAIGQDTLDGSASYLKEGTLLAYWTTITPASLLASATASFAGALVIATHKSVLTAGVMIALALVPTATLTGMALVEGEWDIAGQAALRWLLEVLLVIGLSVVVIIWKKGAVQRRNLLS